MILGVDEVGRGCWAGPLVVGACVLPNDIKIEGLTDSKKLTAKKRLVLFYEIKKVANYGLGWVTAAEIDQIGLSQALKKATREAVSQIDKTKYNQIIIDGTIDFLEGKFANTSTLKKADLLIPSASAAAILAKVSRDQYMEELAKKPKYKNYGFEKHVGYGTKLHREMLEKHGVSDIHRISFRPIAELLGEFEPKHDISGTAKDIGNWGEQIAYQELTRQGYQILTQNWRTRDFEIDIVAEKDDILYLIEVKTRKNDDFGGGIVAINKQKLEKMNLAASVIFKKYPKKQIKLTAVIITGSKSKNKIEIIEI